jgi:metal-dependent HD superfamily phosphatase/phosphodiesterase
MHDENRYSSLMLEDIKKNPIVNSFIKAANDNLGVMGYKEHGLRHVSLISSIAKNLLLRSLDYPQIIQKLTAIAGYIHDVGNVINRYDQSAVLIVMKILKDMGATPEEIALIIVAIGNPEEEVVEPVKPIIEATLILADKSNVHKARVRNKSSSKYDIHDRVNCAVERSFLNVNKRRKTISLHLTIDTQISNVMEYFEIFMPRMLMKRRVANFLNYTFELIINERKLL